MRLLVVGLSTREEAALDFFLDRNFKSWTWHSVAADAQAARPLADVVVLDMAALGWAHWSEAAETQLLVWLQGTPAVLLVSAHDRSWAVVQERSANASMVWLPKPYGTQAMREALDQAAAHTARTAPAVPAEPPGEAPGLTAADFQARLALQAENQPHVFLRVLSEMLSQPDAFEMRFTVQNSLIIHPAIGWIATNTPLQVIYRLCESDALASAVTVRTLDDAQAEERAQRLGMPPQDLDFFLWNLVAATLDKRATAPPR